MPDLQSLTPLDVLRFICGFFFFPHAIGKFTAREASFSFFRAAGFKPAPPFAFLAMGVEVIMGTLLILGLYVRPVGFAAAIYLLICAVAVIKVTKKWLWHIGGCEFPVFWGICCAVLAALS